MNAPAYGPAHPRALLEQQDWSAIAAAAAKRAETANVTAAWAAAAYRAHAKLGDEAQATRWLDEALALAPDNTTLWRDRGLRHQAAGQWDAALACHERAAALRPEVAAYAAAAAFAAFQLQQFELAARHYEAAVALNPDNRSWWLRLARARVLLGELQPAAQAYVKALALGEDATTRHAYDELLRQLRSGSKAASATYYDAVFAESTRYAQPGTESEYAPVWLQLVAWLRARGASHVLDLGCGPGQFAEFVASHLPQVGYTGVDFSGVAVAAGRRRCPQFLFECRELPLTDFSSLPAFDAVVCTEVLEHVEADEAILAALPPGTPIIASVPNFDAFGHLRTFKDAAAIEARYGALIDELAVTAHPLSATNVLWLFHGVRSAQAWQADSDAKGSHREPAIVSQRAAITESILWTDGTRYVQDFLPQFGLPFTTVDASRQRQDAHVALRHDVDWSIENAYAMAVVEHQLGIRSSYYLLHPDGDITLENYFGRIDDGRLVIDPRLFDWANRLLDLGHEVGLHNDLITLALATRRQPAEFLEQIVEAFAAKGMPLRGSVAHGSRRCRDLAYMNYQIFSDLRQMHMAVDYQDSAELFERFMEPEVSHDGHTVRKFELAMADFGLQYEANFVPWEIYISDSSARWSLWHGQEMTRFDKFTPRAEPAEALNQMLACKQPRSAVQALIHACHWSVLAHHQPKALGALIAQRNRAFAMHRLESTVARLHGQPNVRLATGSERFLVYDHKYSSQAQLYQVTSTVGRFVAQLLSGPAAQARDVLEVGCGQGDFLAGVWQQMGGHGVGLGIDGSPTAILACAGRYPQLQWMASDLEHALTAHDELMATPQGPQRYDLVLDKTGAVFINDHAVAQAFFAQLAQLMRPGALYVYVASRHYYEKKLTAEIYAHWPQDWMGLADATFERVLFDDDVAPELRGYHKRAWRKRPSPP